MSQCLSILSPLVLKECNESHGHQTLYKKKNLFMISKTFIKMSIDSVSKFQICECFY